MSVTQLTFDRFKGRENCCTWKTGAKAYLITKGHSKYMSEDLKTEASVADKTNDLQWISLQLDDCDSMHDYCNI